VTPDDARIGAGDALPYMERNLVAGLFHAAASLGIAESADAIARRGIAGRINGDARPRMQVADNTVDLAAARAILARAATLIDDHDAANPASDASAEELNMGRAGRGEGRSRCSRDEPRRGPCRASVRRHGSLQRP
jgi:alkylation response protein AidB-like acyl-CoA dehydrogenase